MVLDLPLVPRLLECMDDAQPPLLIGQITDEGEFQGVPVSAMQLRADSFLAGVLRTHKQLAGPLPWSEPDREMAIRYRLDTTRRHELSRRGVADTREGRFYFLTGGCTMRVKNPDVERCAAGLLLVPPYLEKALTDDFMKSLAVLRRHRGAVGQRRQRSPSPAPSLGSSSRWEVISERSRWEVISEREAAPQGAVPSNPAAGMRMLLMETGEAPHPGAVPSNPTAGMRLLLRLAAGPRRFIAEPEPEPFDGRTSRIVRRGLAARGGSDRSIPSDDGTSQLEANPGPVLQAEAQSMDLQGPDRNMDFRDYFFNNLDRQAGGLSLVDEVMYCVDCEMMLNGSEQYEYHLQGSNHRRAIKDKRRAAAARAQELREQEARRALCWRRGLQCAHVVVLLALLVGLCLGVSETAGTVALQVDRLTCGLLVAFCLVMAWAACRA